MYITSLQCTSLALVCATSQPSTCPYMHAVQNRIVVSIQKGLEGVCTCTCRHRVQSPASNWSRLPPMLDHGHPWPRLAKHPAHHTLPPADPGSNDPCAEHANVWKCEGMQIHLATLRRSGSTSPVYATQQYPLPSFSSSSSLP